MNYAGETPFDRLRAGLRDAAVIAVSRSFP
jgi:hypothetical protein